VYADWLQERGDPRGELIAVQCALHRMPPADPRRVELEEREQALLDAHEAEWRAELPLRRGVALGPFERGFVSAVEITREGALDPTFFDATPLTTVKLRDAYELAGRYAETDWPLRAELATILPPDLRPRIRRLDLSTIWFFERSEQSRPDDDDPEGLYEVLLRERGWEGLRELRLASMSVRCAGALDGLRLERLELYSPSHQSDGDFIAVLTPACLSSLSSLSLFSVCLPDQGSARVLAQRDLSRLRQLEVRCGMLTAPTLAPVLDALGAPGALESLSLRGNRLGEEPLGDEGARLVAQRFPRLAHLDMSGCGITDEGARVLAATGIERLELDFNLVTDASIARRGLSLRFNRIPGAPEQLCPGMDQPPALGRTYGFFGPENRCDSGVLADGRLAIVNDSLLLFDRRGRFLEEEELPRELLLEEELFKTLGFTRATIAIGPYDGLVNPWGGLNWLLSTEEYPIRQEETIESLESLANGRYDFGHGDRVCYDDGTCWGT
jgi:hypothetical protein